MIANQMRGLDLEAAQRAAGMAEDRFDFTPVRLLLERAGLNRDLWVITDSRVKVDKLRAAGVDVAGQAGRHDHHGPVSHQAVEGGVVWS